MNLMNYRAKSYMRVNTFARTFTLTRLVALLCLILVAGLIIIQPARMQDAARQDGRVAIENATNEEYIPDQVIVQLNPPFDIATVAAMYGLDPNIIGELTVGDPAEELVTSYLLRIADGSTVEAKVAQLRADTVRVLFAEPHYLHSAPEAARPSWSVGDSYGMVPAGRKTFNGQWSRAKIRLDEAHQVTRGATAGPNPVPIVVAVLDTGIDFNHPAFAGRLVPGYDFVDGDNNPSEEGSPQIGPYGHGTHVAGIISMVAPEAKIMPIRVLGVDGRGTAFRLALGLKFAVDHGAHVINLSLSTPNQMLLVQDVFYHEMDGIDDVPLTGAVVVAAAGNSGDTVRQYPAGETLSGRPGREVLAVAASTNNDLLTTFSTRGSFVSVMAPGERITSPVPYNRYANWSGTSMAAPLVAGEVALIRAVFPYAEPKDIVTSVKQQAVIVSGQPRRIDVMRAISVDPDRAFSPSSKK